MLEDVEINLKTLNTLIEIESDALDTFLYDAEFLSTIIDGNVEMYRAIFELLPDKQFRMAILPKLLSHLTWCGEHFNSVEKLAAKYPNKLNALWGIRDTTQCANFLNTIEAYNKYREQTLEMIAPIQLMKHKALFLKNLVIIGEAEEQIIAYGYGNIYKQIIRHLKKLDVFIQEHWQVGSFNLESLKIYSGLDASDESDSVKKNEHLKRLRYFKLPELGARFCYYHIKFSDIRVHFYPDESSNRVFVAYVGKHLPLG